MVQIHRPDVKVIQKVDVEIVAVAELINIPIHIVACEVTMPIRITGSEVMVPLDIQGSYIQLPVDIQSQYMNIAIDIVAQTIGNIAIDIAAQTIGELSIKCGDVGGNVDITIASAQKVGIVLEPEWQTKAGNYKNIIGNGTYAAGTGGWVIDQEVPAQKIWYVHQWCIAGFTSTSNTPCRGILECPAATFVFYMGSTHGVGIGFPRPYKLTAGQHLKVAMLNQDTESGTLYSTVGAHEVDA